MPTATWLSSQHCAIDGVAASQHTSFNSSDVGVTTIGGSKSNIRRCCHRFDLGQPPDAGAVPDNPSIESARMLLDITNTLGAAGWAARAQRITNPAWTGYPQTTWLSYDGTGLWLVTGGDVDTVHPVLFTAPAGVSGGVDFAIAGMADLVNDAIALHAGILDVQLKSDEEGLAVNDNFVANAFGPTRPRIEITYAGSATIDDRDPPHRIGIRPAFIARPASTGAGATPARPARSS